MGSDGEGAGRQPKPSGAAGTAAMKRGTRKASGGAAAGRGAGRNQQAGILKFYTDDAPGIQIGPTVILVFSLSFIGCVVLLHIWGKLRG